MYYLVPRSCHLLLQYYNFLHLRFSIYVSAIWSCVFSGSSQKQNSGGNMAEDLGSWRHARRFFLILPSKDRPCRGEGSLQLQLGFRTQRSTIHLRHLLSLQMCKWFPHMYIRVTNVHDVNLYKQFWTSRVLLESADIFWYDVKLPKRCVAGTCQSHTLWCRKSIRPVNTTDDRCDVHRVR